MKKLSKIPLRIFLISALLLQCRTEFCFSKITPINLGLTVSQGQIDYNKMTPSQKDTIAIGLFNPEDYYLDIAVYYPSNQQIVIYRNTGIGDLRIYKTLPQTKDVSKIETETPEVYSATLLSDLKITRKDGTVCRITNREINKPAVGNINHLPKVPLWDPLEDPRAFLYDISFVEQWRSQRSGHPQYWVALGDIDNDGKNEAVYTFWPINDTQYFDQPSTVTVFENVSQNQYRVDWDTTLYYVGGFNIFSNVTDFDHDGNKEFFVRAKDQTNNYRIMICECTGEGNYRFKYSPIGGFASQPMEIQVRDSAIVINGEPKADVWLCESFPPPYSETHVSRYRFNTKSSAGYSFYVLSTPIVNIFAYSLSVGDIDRDGRDEYILGEQQWGSYYFVYLDSTGISSNQGYEKKIVNLNEPLSAGYSFTKDFDLDGYPEGVLCGAGENGGSIGIVKHSGSPGESQFNVMWWYETSIYAPNMGVDTGYIDNHYCVLYPTVDYAGGNHDILPFLVFTKNETYGFYITCFQEIDSMASVNARLFDIDKDGKMNILAPGGCTGRGNWLTDFEQLGVIGIESIGKEIPGEFRLEQNYPNPFNPNTTIKFDVSRESFIEIKLYDILGRVIKQLINQKTKAGSYKINFDGSIISSGVYFCVLFADGKLIDTKKMILIK